MKKLNEKSAKKLTVVLTIIALLLMTVAVLTVLLPGMDGEKYEVTTFSMGAIVQQTLYGQDREGAAQAAANNIALLEDKISWRKEDSDAERLNIEAGGSYIEISESTWELLSLCKDVSEASGGSFDVTIAPLSWLWDFDSGENILPKDSFITAAVDNIDYNKILLGEDNTAALKTRSTAIDLGAVGKGAACDIAVKTYESMNVDRGIVAVGGSIGTYGNKENGGWRIAVQNPLDSSSLGELELPGGSYVSTSGSYEKSFEMEGKLYHHILDPETGYPVENDLLSVTIVSTSGALSDALSTACFVTGKEEGAILLSKYGDKIKGAIFVDKDKNIYLSNGISGSFTLTDEGFKVVENG